MLAKLKTVRRRRRRRPAPLEAYPKRIVMGPGSRGRFGRAQIVKTKGGQFIVRRRPAHLYYVDKHGVVHEKALRKGGQRGHVTCYRKGRKVSCKGRR